MRAAWLLLPSLSIAAAITASYSAGCLRQTEFNCTTNEQCMPNGTCEAVGFCSFPDSACGQRFGDSAGQYANQCVGEGPMGTDGGVDGPPIDSPPTATCPATYAAVTGGTAGHVYRRVATAQNWTTQFTACMGDAVGKSYLAVPNDLAELAAMATLSGVTSFWIGIDDRATEGTYIQASGGPATFLPWATGQPDNAGGGGGQDCVAGATATISDEDCSGNGSSRIAVCECVL